MDIEQRWDRLYAAGETSLSGRQKLFDVRRTEDDISFLRNYFTLELMEKMNLFAYGSSCTHPLGQYCVHCQEVVITGREHQAVLEGLLASRYNYGMPRIVVQDVMNHVLCLEHLNRETTFLERRYATQTLAYIAELWRQPVHLITSDEHRKMTTLTARPD